MNVKIHIINNNKPCGKCRCGGCYVETNEISNCRHTKASIRINPYSSTYHILSRDLNDASKKYSSTNNYIKHVWHKSSSWDMHGEYVGRGRRYYCHECLKKIFPKHSPRKVIKALKVWHKNPVAGLSVKKFVESVLPRK